MRHGHRDPALLPAALVLFSLGASACSVNPATGQRQLALISEAQEIEMGRQADGQIRQSLGLYPDEEVQRYVSRLGHELAAVSERPDLPWEFHVVDDPVVNAFALPGGYIYVTRGIMTHFNSEAELVGVLGHEIGHVTARHAVERISKAQLAGLGLGVAMIASEDFRQFGDLAQLGLGLLFLKFSRDDERQSDDLGLRYLTRAGYDPDEMPETFVTLERVSQAHGGGGIPGWLATHPNPENRVDRLQAQISQLPPAGRDGKVNREAYLRRLDGMVFGEDPREGFFEDNVFYHPGLAFQLTFPPGWEALNQKQSVRAVSPGQDAAVVLTLAEEGSPGEAAAAFFNRQGIERGLAWRRDFYSFRTVPDPGQQSLRGVVGFVEHGGRVLRLLGVTVEGQSARYDGAFGDSLASFRRLTDRRYLDVQPKRVELVEVPRAMSLEELARRYPSTVEMETLAIINGVGEGERLEAGRLVKRVVGGELP